jgi:hypothetical protein
MPTVIASWSISVLCLTHLEHCFLRFPLTKHHQLRFGPDLVLHFYGLPKF